MRKTLFLVVALVIAGFAYYQFIYKESDTSGSINIPDRDFVIEEKDDIATITIKSLGYPLVHLSREGDYWYVNQKYRANPHIVNNMLDVLTRMKINYIPPKSQDEMIKKSIANTGIEIKAYDDEGGLLTDFIMAGNTNAEDGTYIIKRGAQQAYVMSMPMIDGGLRNYFVHEVNALRDKMVFELDTDKLNLVSLTYPKDKRHSYTLKKVNGQWQMSDNRDEIIDPDRVNKSVVRSYIKDFDRLASEYISNDNPARDSIQNKIPFGILHVESREKGAFTLELFPDIDIYDPTVNTMSINNLGEAERYYVRTTWGDFYIVQHRLISKLLKTPEYFLER